MKRTIESLTPPENKQVMWLDVSQEVKQLKAYINGEWVGLNTSKIDDTIDITIDKKTAVLTAEGKWMPSYDASKSRTKRTFLAAPVNADGKADFRAITAEDLPDNVSISA